MIKHLTESQLRQHTTSQSFQRGQDYFESGAVHSVVERGQEIVGQVEGSGYEPYRVRVTLGDTGVAEARCTCPYDWGGWCKHIVAVLLTCLYDPDTLEQRSSLDSRLQALSREALIALVERMVERHPDLDLFVELAAATPDASIDVEPMRKQVRQAFRNAGYDWQAYRRVAETLEQVVDTADGYAERGAWSAAGAIYRVVLETIIEEYGEIHDEEGEIAWMANTCAEKIGACLAETDDDEEREAFLRALYDTYVWDVKLGGYGISDGVPALIQEHATPDERRRVVEWIREVLPASDLHEDDFSARWRRQTYGHLLLELEEEDLDDEAYLQRCRETDQWRELIARLLDLGRVEEAVEEASQVQGHELLSLAHIFEQHGQAHHIEPVLRERVEAGEGDRFLPWLLEQAEQRKDWEEALVIGEQLFWERPTIDRYDHIKRLAEQDGRADAVRAAIIERLIENENYAFLTQLHLFEGEVGQALDCLEQARQIRSQAGWRYPSTDQLALQVARAAEERHPLEAIRLYQEAAEHLINQRGRGNYKMAAEYLDRVRSVYLDLDRAEDWAQEIEAVRERHSNLPALQDELNKAGL